MVSDIQAVTTSEMCVDNWMLSSNVITEDSVATHKKVFYDAETYGGTFLCELTHNALCCAYMFKSTLLLECQLFETHF